MSEPPERAQNQAQKFGQEWKRGASGEAATQRQGGHEEELRESTTTPTQDRTARPPTQHPTHRKLARAAEESVRRGAGAQISNYSTAPEVVAFLCGCARRCCCCCWANQYFCDGATQAAAIDSKHHEKIWEQGRGKK